MAASVVSGVGWVPVPWQHSQPGEEQGALLGQGRGRVGTTPEMMGNRRL